jgi:hypothetical protein
MVKRRWIIANFFELFEGVLRAAPLPNLGVKKIIWLIDEVVAAVAG